MVVMDKFPSVTKLTESSKSFGPKLHSFYVYANACGSYVGLVYLIKHLYLNVCKACS
jgi:hypothetical protein